MIYTLEHNEIKYTQVNIGMTIVMSWIDWGWSNGLLVGSSGLLVVLMDYYFNQ